MSAVGACKSESGTVNDDMGNPHDTYYSTKGVELSAKIDEDAHDTTHLDVQQSFNSISEDMNDGEYGGDKTTMHLRNTTYFAAETLIGEIPYIGTGYNIAKFAYEEFGPGGSKELDPYATGPGGKAGQTFERLGDGASGSDSEDLYGVGTEFRYTFDNDHIPDEFDMTISAKNIMGNYYDGNLITTEDGAEATVSIPIKNSKIKSLRNYPDSQDHTTYDGSVTVSTDIGADLIKHRYVDPKLEYLEINWGDDTGWKRVKTDWKPYYYDYNLQGFINKLVETSHEYQVNYGGTHEYTIQVSAKVQDRYGGWEKVGANEKISIYYYGGGGGGGCPYASPWTGEKYKRENNLLMDSEFESGEVTDKYLLENSLQPKDDSYQMKIEEFENSEDFIDQLQLYTLDHTKDTRLGLTPGEELVSYSKNDLDKPNSASWNDSSILEEVKEKNDKKRATVEDNDTVYLDFGDMTNYRWSQSKLVVTASGFESSTEDDFSTNAEIKSLRSLYFSIKIGDGEWTEVDVVHPRNNPSDYVIPLREAIQKNRFNNSDLDSSLQVRINSTAKHNIDRIALDDSNPTPVKIKEASIREVVKTEEDGETIYQNKSLTGDDNAVMHLVPGESCTIKFDVPSQESGNAFEERDFLVMTKGFYTKYEE